MPSKRKTKQSAAPEAKKPKAEVPVEKEETEPRKLRSALRRAKVETQAVEAEEVKAPIKEETLEESDEESSKSRASGGSKSRGISKRQTRNEALKPHQASSSNAGGAKKSEPGSGGEEADCRFLGDPVPDDEARRRWPKRYQGNNKKKASGASKNMDDEEVLQASRHYLRAEVDGIVYDLYDNAHVKAADGEDNYICRIVEMFEAVNGSLHFTARWFYRASDTVIKQLSHLIDNKRVFLSEIQDDNPLECLVQKLNIAKVPLSVDLEAKKAMIPPCDFYYDMLYLLPYSTFMKVPADDKKDGNESSSTISTDVDMVGPSSEVTSTEAGLKRENGEVTLLDMYSGCGAMSTGLCLGANLGGLNLVTRWAVDINEHACNSLKYNHPETQVRNEAAEDFLALLKEWRKLCIAVGLVENIDQDQSYANLFVDDDGSEDENGSDDDEGNGGEVFEVEKVLDICYGDPKQKKKPGLYLKIRWKGYGPSEDSWEPIDGLGNCGERIKKFIVRGYEAKMLPLPGDVDVVCGGPPCQGISGFNRFRDKNNPLADVKNKQLEVYMEVVEYLKPRFVLMENVVDLIKFANGYLGRYGMGRLIQMNYQVRMGMMAAGAYGLPQFRMRVFLWGARPSEKLPQYPLPTHNVVVRGVIPLEFENHTVAYDEGHSLDQLEKKLLLEDAISDLPEVGTYEKRDEIPYNKDPQTDFQRLIRLTKDALMGSSTEKLNQTLYDHRSLELNSDDYDRVCQIPKKKGANFRDLPGVRVVNNKVEWDPSVERVYLKSGKPLVPDYAMTFVNGTSSKPFGRLWWDETVPTVVTRAEPHNQAILHPEQDRVLSIRENARLQGFPDYYKLTGPVKERYIQVGNAVAVPVARALGYSLSLACQDRSGDSPLIQLPPRFSFKLDSRSSSSGRTFLVQLCNT